MKKISIKYRLTLWNVVVITLIYILTGLMVLSYTESEFKKLTDAKLDIAYKTVDDVLTNSGGDIYDLYHLGHKNPFIIWKNKRPQYMTNLWRESGFPIYPDSLNTFFIIKDGKDIIKYKIKVGVNESTGLEFAYAANITDLASQMGGLRSIIFGGIPLILILAFSGGLFLANRALLPVRDIINVSSKISSENLSQRLPVKNPNDELGQLAKVINSTLSRLENSFDQLKRFTSDASHELRTPLTAIKSVAEVALKNDSAIDANKETLISILEEVDYLTKMVDKLLVLSRGDAGKLTINPVEMNLINTIEETVHELEVLALAKKQTLSFSTEYNYKVKLDAQTFKLAITNVIHNAIKYTPENGNIQVFIQNGKDQKVEIIIKDNGPGIPENQLEKVFDRFYRVDESRDAAAKGTGLGLSITRMLVQLNGGRIWLENNEEGGLSCYIAVRRIC